LPVASHPAQPDRGLGASPATAVPLHLARPRAMMYAGGMSTAEKPEPMTPEEWKATLAKVHDDLAAISDRDPEPDPVYWKFTKIRVWNSRQWPIFAALGVLATIAVGALVIVNPAAWRTVGAVIFGILLNQIASLLYDAWPGRGK
jgi:hypothetical protein